MIDRRQHLFLRQQGCIFKLFVGSSSRYFLAESDAVLYGVQCQAAGTRSASDRSNDFTIDASDATIVL